MYRIISISLAATASICALGLGAGGAAASQVQPIGIIACAGDDSSCSETTTLPVDQQFGLQAKFKVTNSISNGNSIFVEGPPGTEFLSPPPQVILGWKSGGYTASIANVSNENRQVQITVPASIGVITSEAFLEVDIGYFANKIVVPPVPGNFNLDVWTSADTTHRTSSNSITTTLGKPSSLTAVGPARTAIAGGLLDAPPVAKLTDSRGNALPGKAIAFTLPASGAGGSFEGGLDTAGGETNAEGLASPSKSFLANGQAGAWQILLSGPESTAGAVDVTTVPAAAEAVELELAPVSVPADGSTTSTATIRVLDEFGNRVTGDEITLDTEGGPTASEPVLQPDGSFISTLTASTTPGEFDITAEDADVPPGVGKTATLTQTVLPATTLQVSLAPTSLPADGTSTTTVLATVVDELGAGVDGEAVGFTSSGGNQIGPTVDHGDGTYSAVVTSTAIPGTVTISAIDESVAPNLQTGAGLLQTALPVTVLPPIAGPPRVDPRSAPVAKIHSGPQVKTRSPKARFTFSATGAAYFECRLDRGKWSRCKSPKTFTVTPGRHVLRVRAIGHTDVAGPVASRSFERLPRRR
jgi:adhesin/invasin